MIYLHRHMERAVAECEATAQRLEAQGFARCSADVHRALWAIADDRTIAQLRPRPKLDAAVETSTAPVGGDRPPVYELEIHRERDGGMIVIPRKRVPEGC